MADRNDTNGRPRGSYGFVLTAIDLEPARWPRLTAFFGDLEEAGCSTIWLSDHLFSGQPSAEPLVLAGVAAAATERCRIGTGVLQLALRSGAAVAKAASTLQLVSAGRFLLGVGVGQHEAEFGLADAEFSRRGSATNRLLGTLRDCWTASDDWFAMRPAVAAPIWVGGTSDAALDRVVEFGSGWLSLFQTPERFAAGNQRLSAALHEAGRAAESVERRIVVCISPTDGDWSRTDALAWIARQFPGGSAGVERHVVTGSIDDCVSQVRAFEQAGATGVDLQVAHPEPLEPFRALRAALAVPSAPDSRLLMR